jgi:hypothetical protein
MLRGGSVTLRRRAALSHAPLTAHAGHRIQVDEYETSAQAHDVARLSAGISELRLNHAALDGRQTHLDVSMHDVAGVEAAQTSSDAARYVSDAFVTGVLAQHGPLLLQYLTESGDSARQLADAAARRANPQQKTQGTTRRPTRAARYLQQAAVSCGHDDAVLVRTEVLLLLHRRSKRFVLRR